MPRSASAHTSRACATATSWVSTCRGTRCRTADRLLAGRTFNRFALVFYLRQADHVFETYWTNGRGVEAMSYSYGLLDRTVYGRQENWEDSPTAWPKRYGQLPDGSRPAYRIDGRPIAQWPRLAAGWSDALEPA
jgi:hypothetical protein